MKRQSEQPFDSIESTYDFFRVLSEAVAEAKREIEGHVSESGSQSSRRLDALRIASYSLEKLEFHISHSRRVLNDLRTLRRLLFEERAAPKVAVISKPVATSIPEVPSVPTPRPLPSRVARIRAKSGSAVAA